MGRPPNQEHRKDYVESVRGTTWLFATPTDFAECFQDTSERYLTPANKGTRLGKNTFRIVVHLPNKHHNNREQYLNDLKTKGSGTFYKMFLSDKSPFKASRIRWDAGDYPGAHLLLHTNPPQGRGKRVEFFVTPRSGTDASVTVNGQSSFISPISQKPVVCKSFVGMLARSASRKGEYKLIKSKPWTSCPKGLIEAGHAPANFVHPKEMPKSADKSGNEAKGEKQVAEAEETFFAESDWRAFYEAQGMDYDNLLEIQDVEIMDSETEQQAIERAYYNPSAAMVGTDETLDGYRPIDSATVDLTSNQPMANYGAEGETATYAPSEEPDMVSSASFDEPTNAHFSAEGCPNCGFGAEGVEGATVADVEASVEPANEPIAVAEGTSLDGYAPIDSLEEGAPIGHGVNQYFGSAETSFAMEGTEGALLDESTTNITVEEGVSLDGYSGIDSVAVEAPLGHGVTQWYAEGEDSPEPQFDSGITGQDGPSDTPTNSHFSAEGFREYHASGRSGFVFPKRKAWPIGNKKHAKLAIDYMNRGWGDEAEYPKIRAAIKKKYGTLNLASQGYNDRKDEQISEEDGPEKDFSETEKDRRDDSKGEMEHLDPHHPYADVSTMEANTIVDWRDSKGRFKGGSSAHDSRGRFLAVKRADTAGYLQDGSLSMDGYTPLESVDVDRTSYQPNQNYGAEFEGERWDTVKEGGLLGLGAGATLGIGALAMAAALGTVGMLVGAFIGNKNE